MDVVMPQLGETVTEGTVVTWHKKPGESVKADELLFDVETDKVAMEVPAPAAGVLREVLVREGETVAVGTRLAVIEEAGATASVQPAARPNSAQVESRAPRLTVFRKIDGDWKVIAHSNFAKLE